MNVLPQRLKEKRTKAGLTQQEVADRLGVTRPAYTQYETGKNLPSLDIVARLADIFETSVDYLIGRY